MTFSLAVLKPARIILALFPQHYMKNFLAGILVVVHTGCLLNVCEIPFHKLAIDRVIHMNTVA